MRVAPAATEDLEELEFDGREGQDELDDRVCGGVKETDETWQRVARDGGAVRSMRWRSRK